MTIYQKLVCYKDSTEMNCTSINGLYTENNLLDSPKQMLIHSNQSNKSIEVLTSYGDNEIILGTGSLVHNCFAVLLDQHTQQTFFLERNQTSCQLILLQSEMSIMITYQGNDCHDKVNNTQGMLSERCPDMFGFYHHSNNTMLISNTLRSITILQLSFNGQTSFKTSQMLGCQLPRLENTNNSNIIMGGQYFKEACLFILDKDPSFFGNQYETWTKLECNRDSTVFVSKPRLVENVDHIDIGFCSFIYHDDVAYQNPVILRNGLPIIQNSKIQFLQKVGILSEFEFNAYTVQSYNDTGLYQCRIEIEENSEVITYLSEEVCIGYQQFPGK
ncbi:uncharacterized protein [Clytia hemisphaerica]|uniref:uncharacterized protein n=1 Tax=Clytia hemisphaerica TaxID=252671 RepID=UPI0034D3E2DD